MIRPNPPENLILASQSPRRKELLQLLGIPFSVCVSDIEENFNFSLPLEKATENLALQKATAVQARYPGKVILGADTIVVLDEKILGKPKNKADAFSMLSLLSGRTHQVITGVCILSPEKEILFSQKSHVHFFPLSSEEIHTYIATGDSMDKAGAYAVQGKSCVFIKGITGDFFNVMGFPIAKFKIETEDILTVKF